MTEPALAPVPAPPVCGGCAPAGEALHQGDRLAGHQGIVRQARSPPPDPQPGDVHRRARLGDHHRYRHPGGVPRRRHTLWFTAVVSFWLWLTVIFANIAEAVAEGRGKAQADTLRATPHDHARPSPHRHRRDRGGARLRAPARRPRARERGRGDPRRRRRRRGCRLGRRVGHHRRVGPRDPRGRRRSLGRDRRHPAAVRRAGGAGHPGAGQVVPRPHDRPGRGRRAAQDAERDRAQHPAGRAHDRVRGGHRHPGAVCRPTPTRGSPPPC